MRIKSFMTAAIAVAFLSCANSALAFGGEGRVEGTVLDASGAGVAGAAVKVTRADVPTFSMDKTSDAKGGFRVLLLDASKVYRFHIEKDGYLPLDQDVQPTVGETVRVNFTLKPLPTLEEELATPETEPLAKQLRLNLRFARAKYAASEEPPLKFRKYVWSYPEISVILDMADFPAGTLSGPKPEATAAQVVEIAEGEFTSQGGSKLSERKVTAGAVAGKEDVFRIGNRTVYVRIFVVGETRYELVVEAVQGDQEKLIHRVLDTFQFAKQ